jgi:prolyl-tRNA editing enzyme YbaK/EbsC (Cys-tRNA(Pro) deacylase)
MRTSVDVANYLAERDVAHELIPARGRLRTAERIAAVLDLPPEYVGKVRVFETDVGPVVVLVPSHREPDIDRVKRALGAKDLATTTAAQASRLTEYLAEAIPPVGLPEGIRVVMDRALVTQNVLYFHGGEARALLKVRGRDLARAARAKVASITATPIPA